MVSMKQAEVTRDREKEVVVPGGQVGKLVFEHLGHGSCVRVRRSNSGLCSFWQDFRRKITEPSFEQGANNVNVV